MGTRAAVKWITVVSALLGAGVFVYVLVFAPIDVRRSPRAAALNQRPSIGSTRNQIRSALANGQRDRAMGMARQLLEAYEDRMIVRLEFGLTCEVVGRREDAVEHWAWILGQTESEADEVGPGVGANAYARGWALRAVGREEASVEQFAALSALVESQLMGRPSSLLLYNLACYRAMSGDADGAIAAWIGCVDLGYGSESGWWMVDPDLKLIRGDPRFFEAAIRGGLVDEVIDPHSGRGSRGRDLREDSGDASGSGASGGGVGPYSDPP